MLIALCEHNVFTPGTIWGIDSFDPIGAANHPGTREQGRTGSRSG